MPHPILLLRKAVRLDIITASVTTDPYSEFKNMPSHYASSITKQTMLQSPDKNSTNHGPLKHPFTQNGQIACHLQCKPYLIMQKPLSLYPSRPAPNVRAHQRNLLSLLLLMTSRRLLRRLAFAQRDRLCLCEHVFFLQQILLPSL